MRTDPRTTPMQLAFLDAVQERRDLLAHLRDRHDRIFPKSHVALDELRQVHRVLDEAARGE